MAKKNSSAGTVAAVTDSTDSVGAGNRATVAVGGKLVTGTEASIKVASISVRKGWNMRREFDAKALETLAESMRAVGQLSSIVVCADGKSGFWIVAGERRWRAAKLAGMAEIRAVVIPEALALRASVAENFDRNDISMPDRIRFLHHKHTVEGIPQKELAEMVGLSYQTISNDCTMGEKLAPDILDSWSANPGAMSKVALQIMNKPHDVQRQVWQEENAKREAKEANGGKRTPRGPKPAGGPPSKSDLGETYATLNRIQDASSGLAAPVDAGWLAGALWALEYVAGQKTDASDGMPAYPTAIEGWRQRLNAPAKQAELFDKGSKVPAE